MRNGMTAGHRRKYFKMGDVLMAERYDPREIAPNWKI